MEKTKLWFLENFDLFQNMSNEEIESVEEHVFIRNLRKGERVNFAKKLNKYVYLLNDGVLKLVATDDEGKETIVCLVQKGNLFGALPLLGDFEVIEDYAEAVDDSVISFIDTDKFRQWMTDNHELRTKLRSHLGSKMTKIENRLLSMIFKDAKTRIYEFLRDFTNDFGVKNEEGIEVKNFLTNDEVAKLTATSRQTVNSVLNELRENKIIEYNKDRFFIAYSSPILKV